jgi:hypothetical protein
MLRGAGSLNPVGRNRLLRRLAARNVFQEFRNASNILGSSSRWPQNDPNIVPSTITAVSARIAPTIPTTTIFK